MQTVRINLAICCNYSTGIKIFSERKKRRGVLVLLKLQVKSQKLGVQAPQNLEFE